MPLASWTGVYGEEVTLAEAERQAPFEILLPESLGEPDLVYRYRDPSGGLVITAVYGDGSVMPASSSRSGRPRTSSSTSCWAR